MALISKTARMTGLRLRSRIILMLIFYLEMRMVMEAGFQTTRESSSINRMSSQNISFLNISFL
jgi:hypothetical protein